MSVFIPNSATRYLSVAWAGSATQELTLMCWVKLTGVVAAYRNMVGIAPNIAMSTFSDGVTADFGTLSTDNNGPVLPTGSWVHMAMTVLPSSTTLRWIRGYINGTLTVDNPADAATFTAHTTLILGNWPGPTYVTPLTGNLRDVRIFTRVLPPWEIRREMDSPRPISNTNLLVWSTFDKDQRTDQSGHGRIWTVTGTGILTQSGPLIAHPGRGMQSFR